ncbi:MAG TPA: hypothetical protein VJC39_04750 [Candidatus Nanoarchaeia archaeon]|nr:hypothetical protein [Candidatus Nanoarchaeia archaeon]
MLNLKKNSPPGPPKIGIIIGSNIKQNNLKSIRTNITILAVIFLFVNLPLANALHISNVQVKDITSSQATITWQTDNPADSQVNYGPDKINLQSLSSDQQSTLHEIKLTNLNSAAAYFYSVASNQTVDNNGGNYYSFSTLKLDVPAGSSGDLTIKADLPAIIQGNVLTISGETQDNVRVALYVNNIFSRTVVTSSGDFNFPDVFLEKDQTNTLLLEAKDDETGESGWFLGQVISDTHKPTLTLEDIPTNLLAKTIELKGSISEESEYEILVNNKSVQSGKGLTLAEKINLEEGENTIRIILTDTAGWQSEQELILGSDTKPPVIKAYIARGNEYYDSRDITLESRASSDIYGETEPGAAVYLYIFRPQITDSTPNFKKARAKATADETGQFRFESVNFVSSWEDISLEDLSPKEIPASLQGLVIPSVKDVSAQQTVYYIYLIAEDSSGKLSQPWKESVTINSCFSDSLDFGVDSELPYPSRLNPSLMDQGKAKIGTVFRLSYSGQGLPVVSPSGEELQSGYRITSLKIEKACTQNMIKDETFGLGCKLLPASTALIQKNNADSAFFVEWKLNPSEDLSKNEANFWDDLAKREMIFPIKIALSYQERIDQKDGKDVWGETKVQTVCKDMAYLVDIPANTADLIPDFLANEAVDALDFTVNTLNDIVPVVEKVYLVTAIVSFVSLGLQWVARFARDFISKTEAYFSTVKKGISLESGLGCPLGQGIRTGDQGSLYLRSTIEDWHELWKSGNKIFIDTLPVELVKAFNADGGVDGETVKKLTLDERCPSTAAAWKFEAAMDQIVRWTWSRAFCREVPAGWTATKTVDEIGAKILEQNQCAITGKGIPLVRVENCQEKVKAAIVSQPVTVDAAVCWMDQNGILYYRDELGIQKLSPEEKSKVQQEERKGYFKLTPIVSSLGDLKVSADQLLVYQPSGSQDFIVGKDLSCSQVCNAKSGYKPVTDGIGKNNACYRESLTADGKTQLVDKNGQEIKHQNAFSAGYTSDCFVNQAAGAPLELSQCICEGAKKDNVVYQSEDRTRRTAPPQIGEIEESWSYHQERVFKESNKRFGTHYPEIRYYSGRDVQGAFGADYIFDYARSEPQEPSIDPHDGIIETFQSVCLVGIRNNLLMIQQFSTGLRNCLVEAKHSGLQDAGACKTIFAQHICGLAYQAVGMLNNACSPSTFDDVGGAGPVEDFGVVSSNFFKSAASSLDSTFKDVREEYGNAAFNKYFEAGAQGFAQSMCMAAFGLEDPLFGEDFLMDIANSYPMATTPIVTSAKREFSSYNPARGTAAYSYQLGGIVFPGCKIKRLDIKLKCIGPEDIGGYGADTSCDGEGCDCLAVQNVGSSFEGEKEKLVKTLANLKSGQLVDLKIESPQVIDSHYRYDHVILELQLDPSEKGNEGSCFDQEVLKGSKAVYYTPISDFSLDKIGCAANTLTGKFECKEIASLFGFDGASLEQPYLSCWNKRTEQWVSCDTPNLFVLGDEIRIRPHINNNADGICLKRTISPVIPGIQEVLWSPLPENLPGSMAPPQVLGIVEESMLGSSVDRIGPVAGSNPSCNAVTFQSITGAKGSGIFKFSFEPTEPTSEGKVKLFINDAAANGVKLSADGESLQYNINPADGKLLKGQQDTFTLEEIAKLTFEVPGFKLSTVLGKVQLTDLNKVCAYKVFTQNEFLKTSTAKRTFQITYELYEKEGDSCLFANTRVKSSSGQSIYSGQITIQKEETAFSEQLGLHNSFITGNYDVVNSLALDIINQRSNDLRSAIAIYYETAVFIMKGQQDNKKYTTEAANLLRLFFDREWGGGKLADWPEQVVKSGEYQKIKVYMCEIDEKYENKHESVCKP